MCDPGLLHVLGVVERDRHIERVARILAPRQVRACRVEGDHVERLALEKPARRGLRGVGELPLGRCTPIALPRGVEDGAARRAGDGLVEPLAVGNVADDVPRGVNDGLPETLVAAPTTFPAAPSTRLAIPEGMGICPPRAAPAALVTPVTSASPTLCPVVAAPMTPAAA